MLLNFLIFLSQEGKKERRDLPCVDIVAGKITDLMLISFTER